MKPLRWLATAAPEIGVNLWPKLWVEWCQRTNGFRGVAKFALSAEESFYHRVHVTMSRPIGTVSVSVDPEPYCQLLGTSIRALELGLQDLQWITVWLHTELKHWHRNHPANVSYRTPIDYAYLDGEAEVVE